MQNNLIPVEGYTHLARDRNTGAIVNINTSEIQQARMRKDLRQQKEMQLDRLQNKVDHLSEQVEALLSRLENNNDR